MTTTHHHHSTRVLALLIAAATLITLAARADVAFPPEQYVSHTLPVLYITTADSVPITSKTEYVAGGYWLDDMGLPGVERVGSPDSLQPLQIRGRGNSSWTHAKKPYRIKLGEKTPLLGMKKSKHFVLLVEWREGQGRINWETGFYVSRLMGLPWTPEHHPIELVLNGEYQGLYFLTENIRVDKGRVNITEQADGATGDEEITGGWLCEIDNYNEDGQVRIYDRNTGKILRHTIHSPEVLSEQQRAYITDLINTLDRAIHCRDKTSTEWERYIDIDLLARYYLANEIVDEIECFGGSCYWWKDRGDSSKIGFGPVWDFDCAGMSWSVPHFCYENHEGDVYVDRNHWIAELMKFPRLQQRVRELWQCYDDSAAADVRQHAEQFARRVRAAHYQDVLRWIDWLGEYPYHDIELRGKRFLDRLESHRQWLNEQWSRPADLIGDANGDECIDSLDVAVVAGRLLGLPVDTLVMANANAYCDDTLDVSDLVGVERQVFHQLHPAVLLTYPQLLPYGQSDKAIDPHLQLALTAGGGSDTLRLGGAEPPMVELRVNGGIHLAAMQFDVVTQGATVCRVEAGGTTGHRARWAHAATADSASRLTRVVIYSDSLASLHCSDLRIAITLAPDTAGAPSLPHTIAIAGARLAEADMFPHSIAPVAAAIVWQPAARQGDLDGDGRVDIVDLNLLLNVILELAAPPAGTDCDLDGDSVVDIADVNRLINLILSATPGGSDG